MKLIKAALLLSSFTCLESIAMDFNKSGLGDSIRRFEQTREMAEQARQLAWNNGAGSSSNHAMTSAERTDEARRQLLEENLGLFQEREDERVSLQRPEERQRRARNRLGTLHLDPEDLSIHQTQNSADQSLVSEFLAQERQTEIQAQLSHELAHEAILTVANYERLLANPTNETLLHQVTLASYQAYLKRLYELGTPQKAWENRLLYQPNNDRFYSLIRTLEKAIANWDETYHPDALQALYYAARSFAPCAEYLNNFGERLTFSQQDLLNLLENLEKRGLVTSENIHELFSPGSYKIDADEMRRRFPDEFRYNDYPNDTNLHGFDQNEWLRYERSNQSGNIRFLGDTTYGPSSILFAQLRVLPVFLPQGLSALMVLNAAENGYRLVNLALPADRVHPYEHFTLRNTITRQDLVKYRFIADGIRTRPEFERAALYESLRMLMASEIDKESETLPERTYNSDVYHSDYKPSFDWRVSKHYWNPNKEGGFPDWTELNKDHWNLFSEWANPNRSRL